MVHKRFFSAFGAPCLLLIVTLLYPPSLLAQGFSQQGTALDPARKTIAITIPVTENPETTWGIYETRMTLEAGGRVSDFTGNQGLWNTFVNLGSGPRLMEGTLELHSPTRQGVLFDDLTVSNFGYGGEPSNLSRLRISKNKIYDFNYLFRRDQNFFDYNLLANPLNPATSDPALVLTDSPHEFQMVRRMSDATLTLFPQSKVSFRLGYARILNEGDFFSSVRQGTEASLLVPSRTGTDRYRAGFSVKAIPRTTISYDQFYTYTKVDNNGSLSSALFPNTVFDLTAGTPVNLGLSYNTAAWQPCATPILGTGLVNPACNGFFSYTQFNRTRTTAPSEQVSLQSKYFRRLELNGRFSYMDAELEGPNPYTILSSFTGFDNRTDARAQTFTGTFNNHDYDVNADFGAVYRVTNKLRIVDTFRWENHRIPGFFSLNGKTLFGATLLSNPNAFNSATCPPPFTAATCPQHVGSSGPDQVQDVVTQILKQMWLQNTLEVQYDFTRRFTARLGYRFLRRDIVQNVSDIQTQTILPTNAIARGCLTAAGCILVVPFGDQPFEALQINGHTALVGFTALPMEALRISFDTELFSADNSYTPISPRHQQWYRARVNYKPGKWISFGSAINIRENRNNSTVDIGNKQHDRSYSFSSVIVPGAGKWGFDLSYDYDDVFSTSNICFSSSPSISGATSCGAPLLQAASVYKESAHFGNGSLFFSPVQRVTATVGYGLTSTTGSALLMNPNQTPASLNYSFHQPTGSLAVQLTKPLQFKFQWNYYDYNQKEGAFGAGPGLPLRDFRGNSFALALRYSM